MIPIFYRPEQSSAAAVGYSPSAGKPAKVVADWMGNPDISPNIRIESFDPLNADDIKLAHDPAYVGAVLSCREENGFGNRNLDVAASLPYTTGSLFAAAKYAVENRTLAVSPTSGFHHANYRYGGGFCTFNGLVIAALKLRQMGLIKHVLIIDGDAHFGDGTESCIAATKSSSWIKQITASANYSSAKEFFDRIDEEHLMSDYAEFWTDISTTLVIYQAGADAWERDPLNAGVFTLEELRRRDEHIIRFSRRYKIPLAINLAGGYAKDAAGTIEPVLRIHRQTMLASIEYYQGLNHIER